MSELISSVYFLIGFLITIWRLSKVTKEEDSSMACIAGLFIMVLWPLYLVYKAVKKHYKKNKV